MNYPSHNDCNGRNKGEIGHVKIHDTVTYVIVDLILSVMILMRTMTGINVKIAFRLNLENVLKDVVQFLHV